MLPFDHRPWAKPVARLVILLSILAALFYVFVFMHDRTLDTGERFIVGLLLLTIIPPNVAILRRKPGAPVQHHDAAPKLAR